MIANNRACLPLKFHPQLSSGLCNSFRDASLNTRLGQSQYWVTRDGILRRSGLCLSGFAVMGAGGGGGRKKKPSSKGKCGEKNSCKEEGKFMQKEGPIVTFILYTRCSSR